MRNQRRPIDASLPNRPAKRGRVLEILAEMGSIHEQFFRNTADVDTGAAQISLFRHRDFGAIAGRHAASAHPTRAGADGEEVEIVLSHVFNHLSRL